MKKRKYKLTRPNDGISKPHLKAFRCTDEVWNILESLPAREVSKHINKIILEDASKKYVVTCPTCNGHGKIRMVTKKKKKLIRRPLDVASSKKLSRK